MTYNLNNPLSVPISIDAAWANGTESLAPPATDFSALTDTVTPANGNFSNAQPWLGDTTHISPESDFSLEPGVHLHWELPASLRHGVNTYVFEAATFNDLSYMGLPPVLLQSLQNAVTIGQNYTFAELNTILQQLCPQLSTTAQHSSDFLTQATSEWNPILLEIYTPLIIKTTTCMLLPPVPNRWLIIRQDKDGSTAGWVVESDRLTAASSDGSAPTGSGPAALPAMFTNAFVGAWTTVQPADTCSYLGFNSQMQSWQEQGTSLQRLLPFTAAGNGHTEFSAFYANCRNVFGFHDASAAADKIYTYSVIGWFSDAGNDPLSQNYNILPWSAETDRSVRLQKLGWHIDNPDWNTIDGSVYTAQISVSSSNCALSTDVPLDSVDVAIGNTAGEALSAYLASGETANSAFGLSAESALNALQAGIVNQVTGADGATLIENTLHMQAFKPDAGGTIWKVSIPPPVEKGLKKKGQPNETVTLNDTLAQALNKLNITQIAYDRAIERQKTERHLLFTDWCRSLRLDTVDSAYLSGSLQNAAGKMVNIAASGIDTAVSEILYEAAAALYIAYFEMTALLAFTPETASYILKRQPAPRYWSPNPPVVMMTADANGPLCQSSATTLPQTTIGGNSYLVLSTYTTTNQAAAILPGNWNTNAGVPSSSYISAALQAMTPALALQSWRPLSLYWVCDYSSYPGKGTISTTNQVATVTDYTADFITANFETDGNGIDLVPKTGITPQTAETATYQGRATLSSHAATTMRDQILRLTQASPGQTTLVIPPDLGTNIAALINTAYDNKKVTLSQALSGFNEHLLMLNPVAQVSLFDTNYSGASWNSGTARTWDSSTQSFYNEIGLQKKTSPRQTDTYNPIRAGKCALTQLTLVDAFGQTRNWSYAEAATYISETLQNMSATGANAEPAFFLPPRFTQPSRLLFRWIAADGSGEAESNQHPATTPVCGWVTLNRVDETVMFFTQAGILIGWTPAGGGAMIYMPDMSAGNITDPYLQQVITQAETEGSSFYEDISTALLTIEPHAHRSYSSRTVLESRPLAIARASLNLELAGAAAPHQGYGALNALTQGGGSTPPVSADMPPYAGRETCAFAEVAIPARLGDVSVDNDGLVAYWSMTGTDISSSYQLISGDEGGTAPSITLAADAGTPATYVLMLLDPKAPVHVTTGILPVKDITIPPDLYQNALRNMEFLMSAGPVLTPAQGLAMPVPAETGAAWTWLTLDNSNWAPAQAIGKIDDLSHPEPEPAQVESGYLHMGGKS